MIRKTIIKILSIVLAISIICSSIVFANNDDIYLDDNEYRFCYFGQGTFIVDNSDDSLEPFISINSLQIGSVISALKNEADNIYQIDANYYLIKAYDNVYIIAEKLTIDHADLYKSRIDYYDYGIPEEVWANIENSISEYNGVLPKNYEIVIFVPAKLSNNTSSGNRAFDSPGTSYYTYNGYNMKKYVVRVSSNTGLIEKQGTSALQYAKSTANVLISAGGVVSQTLSVFGAVTSIFSFFYNLYGDVTVPSSGDRVYINEFFDKNTQMTFVQISGQWVCGATSYAAKFKTCDVYQVYKSANHGYLINIDHADYYYYSEHYNNPSSIAISYATSGTGDIYEDDDIYLKVFNTWVRIL